MPVFRADMTALDLTSMVEVSYRVNGVTVFNFDSVEPVDFLGGSGVKLRYNYASGIGIYEEGQLRDARRRSEAVRDETRGRRE